MHTELYPQIPVGAAAFMPIRTDTWKNFAVDLFVPITARVNEIMKTKNVALRILAALGTLFLDALTFPVRLLFTIPRLRSMHNRGHHPLQSYFHLIHNTWIEEAAIVRLEMSTSIYATDRRSVLRIKAAIIQTILFTYSTHDYQSSRYSEVKEEPLPNYSPGLTHIATEA